MTNLTDESDHPIIATVLYTEWTTVQCRYHPTSQVCHGDYPLPRSLGERPSAITHLVLTLMLRIFVLRLSSGHYRSPTSPQQCVFLSCGVCLAEMRYFYCFHAPFLAPISFSFVLDLGHYLTDAPTFSLLCLKNVYRHWRRNCVVSVLYSSNNSSTVI